MALEIFKLVGSILVDSKAAEESLSKTDNKALGVGKTLLSGIGTAAKWGATVVSAGVQAGKALVSLATDTAATADEIDKMSQKIGISREAYQELDYVLSQNGMDVNSLQGGMKTLVNTMQSAQQGGKSAQSAFDALGVSILDTEGNLRSQEEVFFDAIAALQNMENETERNALANDLFGRSATEMIPLLNAGAGSMEELRAKAHDLGLVLDDDVIDSGVELTDTMDSLNRTVDAMKMQLGAQIMPLVTQGAQFLIDNVIPVLMAIISTAGPALGDILADLLPPLLEIVQAALPVLIQLLDILMPLLTWLFENILMPWITFLTDTVGAVLGWLAETALPWIVDAVTAVGDAFASLKEGIDDRIESIKSKIQSFQDKVQNVKDRIHGFVENIKSFFNFSISWPNIPMPHFGINPSGWTIGDLLQGSIPSLSIDWYAKAMEDGRILTRPTIFGYDEDDGRFLAGGERGSEAIVGTASLMRMVRSAAAEASGARDDEIVAILLDIQSAIESLAAMTLVLYPDTVVGRLAKPMDEALGLLRAQKARGTT